MLRELLIFDFNIAKFYTFFHFYVCFQNIIFFKFIIFLFLTFQEVTWRVRKNFLHFRKWSFFTSYLKNSRFVFRRTLRVFLFFLFSFLQMFSLLIAFVHLTVFFTFCVVFTSATDLRRRFLLLGIFYLTLLPAFFKAFLGWAVLPWRLKGFLLRFDTQTRPIYLFQSQSVRQLYDK